MKIQEQLQKKKVKKLDKSQQHKNMAVDSSSSSSSSCELLEDLSEESKFEYDELRPIMITKIRDIKELLQGVMESCF